MKYARLFLIGIAVFLYQTNIAQNGEPRTTITDPRTTFFPKVNEQPSHIPSKHKVWVVILAGQSNMAGRGQVEPEDTIADKRILTIDNKGNIIVAKEPLNLFEPTMKGLDCGVSFARTLLPQCPKDVSILVIHAAVGGSAINQWINDSLHRTVRLYSNFDEKVAIGKRYGTIKAILWHQGESDANEKGIPIYMSNLEKLFSMFRASVGNNKLPIIMGQLGSFSKVPTQFNKVNEIMEQYILIDKYTGLIKTADLMHRGDSLHFNTLGQRAMGQRYVSEFLKKHTYKFY